MIEKVLKDRFEKIFQVRKVTFDSPADLNSSDLVAPEQETLFIEIGSSRTTFKDKLEIGKIIGRASIFAQQEKLPYGFFAKQIAAADAALTKDIFFTNIDENKGRFLNLTERSFGFVFLFDGQFDPALGSIESINLDLQEDLE